MIFFKVIPAEAGIQSSFFCLDPRFRGDDSGVMAP
jgi:hypothetical protein